MSDEIQQFTFQGQQLRTLADQHGELTGDDFSLKIPTTALDLLAATDTGENQSADTGRN